MTGRAFKFDEPGSRVLRQWNEQRARERLIAQRAQADMKRNWWSGVVGVTASGFAGGAVSRLTASMAQWSGSINADLDNSLTILRARARQLCQNSEFGRRFLSLVANNVIGAAGPVLQVRAMTDGATPVLDKVANDLIEVAYAQWCKRADVRGLMDCAHLQRVAIKSVARDGEALIRLVRDRSLPDGLAVQLLEADRLDESMNARLENGNIIRQGVEVDKVLRPVAYHIKASHPGENYQGVAPQAERVPAEQIIHAYLPERAEQVRGYSWLHAVLVRATRLHNYEDAAVIAAQVGASKLGAFTRKEEGAGTALGNQLADQQGPGGVPQMTVQPGEFLDLTGMPGVSLESWNPEYPHANFESFLKTCWYGLGTGLDVAAHNLSGDMTGVNFSSARIAELSERDTWQVLQAWWIRTVTFPVFVAWLESALILGRIRFAQTGRALPWEKLGKFVDAARFQGRRWQWVDPQNEIEASEREVALGIRSRTEIAASQGREFEDVVDELAQEKALLEAAGLATSQQAPAQQPPADPNEEDQETESDRLLKTAVAAALQQGARPIHVDARSTVTVPERSVEVKAGDVNVQIDPIEVTNEVQPPEVVVNNMPVPDNVQTIERDPDKEITRITTRALKD